MSTKSKRLTATDARVLANLYKIDLHRDFHALGSDEVARVITCADCHGYRAPKHANGSRARYFHAYLRRSAKL